MSKDGLLEAANRFASKAEVAKFETGTDELKLARAIICEQIPAFSQQVSEISPALGDALEDELDGMGSTVFDLLEEHDISDERADPEGGYAVHYSFPDMPKGAVYRQNAKLVPTLMISTGAIHRVHDTIDPLFASKTPNNQTKQNQVRASAVMAAWMGLGKWAFDKVDPRQPTELNAEQQLALLLHTEGSNFDVNLITDAEQIANKLDLSLFYIKRRFVGALAYRGLAISSVGQEVGTMPDGLEIKIFQSMFGQLVKGRIQQGATDISAMDLSLAFPFSRSELGQAANFFAHSGACWANAFDATKIS